MMDANTKARSNCVKADNLNKDTKLQNMQQFFLSEIIHLHFCHFRTGLQGYLCLYV